MDNLWGVITSNYIINVGVTSWFSAQLIKTILTFFRFREVRLERMFGAGGMPSSHSATVCGLTVAVGRVCSLDSPMFAISLIMAFIVMYDATGVRRAAGEQARVLNRMMQERDWIGAQKALKEFLGHTPMEVFGGAVLGIVLAYLLPLA